MLKNIVTALFIAGVFASCQNSTESKQTNESTTAHGSHDHSQHAASAAPTAPASSKTAPAEFLPDFKFYKVKSGFGYGKADIPAGKNTIFILFDPSCSHCQHETQALANNYDKIKDVNILYVSMNDPALMVNFLPTFGKALDGKPNVEVLYDRNQEFIRNIHIPDIFPANYVFDANGKLVTYWEGEKHIDDIIKEFTK